MKIIGYPTAAAELPPPTTAAGTQKRREFIGNLLDILGDCRFLWLPNSTDTTTTTDSSLYARTFTYDASIAGKMAVLGSGLSLAFDGTATYASCPDADSLSLGDGLNDSAMSVVALVKPTDTALLRIICAKDNITTGTTLREWQFGISTADLLEWNLFDNSAGVRIARYYNTALTFATWQLLAGTYDGSRSAAGLKVSRNAVRIDDTDNSSASYVAMENLTSVVYIGAYMSTAAVDKFFPGSMAFVALTHRQLLPDDEWAIKSLSNAYYGLSL